MMDFYAVAMFEELMLIINSYNLVLSKRIFKE